MHIRKTKDEYQLMTNYGYGWECEVVEFTLKEIKQRKKEYLKNTNAMVKVVKKRIKL